MALVKNKSLLIKDTTKEERKEIVKEAIAIGTIECKKPPKEIVKLYGMYVEGLMELSEIKYKIQEYIQASN